jgi:hypothetical protein
MQINFLLPIPPNPFVQLIYDNKKKNFIIGPEDEKMSILVVRGIVRA